jgi:nucleoside-diphosphate-sugar epimerase
MTVLVIGASGQIGQFLLPRLVEAGYDYLALSRQPVDGDPRWIQGGLPDAMPEFPPLRAVVSLGPLDHLAPWLSATRLAGTPHLIATSSMSAETKRESDVPAERELSRRLRDAETTLIATCASRGMPWTLFRPTLIYGAGVDKSLTPIVHAALRRRIFPVPAGRGQRQPVHADDIAAAVVAALGSPFARGQTFPIGGGERMSARDMFRRTRRSAGGFALPVPIPRFALTLATLVSPGLRGPVDRLDSDLIADNRELERVLDVHPRPFHPVPGTWRPRH